MSDRHTVTKIVGDVTADTMDEVADRYEMVFSVVVTMVVMVADLTTAIIVPVAQESESLMRFLPPYHVNTRICFIRVVTKCKLNMEKSSHPEREKIPQAVRCPRNIVHRYTYSC
jgi:predicted transporter